MNLNPHDALYVGLSCIVVAGLIGAVGISIDRAGRTPKVRAGGAHTRRGVRRARRAEARAQDDATIAWVFGLKRRVPALAIARARVAGLLAVLPDRRAPEPPCPRYEEDPAAGWMTAPGPWDTDEARAELVPLPDVSDRLAGLAIRHASAPPLPVDLARLASDYSDLFSHAASCVFCGMAGLPLKAHHGGDLVCADDEACLARGPLPQAEPTVVELTIVDAPPDYLDELRTLLAGTMAAPVALPGPNAAAGNWTPRPAIPGPLLDWDPAIDDPGLIHLRYPWADQVVADFDWAPVSRGLTST